MRLLFVIFSSMFFALNIKAQDFDPLTISKKIMSRDTFPDIKKHFTEEYKGHPNGYDIPKNVSISIELLNQENKHAVVAVTLIDSLDNGFDAYLHFKKDTIWKICAFRALAMTGLTTMVYDQVSKLNDRQVDSIISSHHYPEIDARLFKSKNEYHYLLGNSRLILSSDKMLIAYFNKNRYKFEVVRNQLLLRGIFKSKDGTRGMKNIDSITKQLKELYIDNVYPNSEGTKKTLNFLIGGITDNSVGFFYIKDKRNISKMTPDHFIMVRNLGNGWYLYKTT